MNRYNYESPLTKMVSDITREMTIKEENEAMSTIERAIGFNVDKDELIKALNYDRHQYEKGFNEAKTIYEKALDKMIYKAIENSKADGCYGCPCDNCKSPYTDDSECFNLWKEWVLRGEGNG